MGRANAWVEQGEDYLTGHGYQQAVQGWKNSETGAEVLLYRVEGTGAETFTDKTWGVQHPYQDGENVAFFDERDDAEGFARQWIAEHHAPEAVY